MNVLYDRKIEKEEIYEFAINSGGEYNLKFSTINNKVQIIFKNEKFVSVSDTIADVDKQSISYMYVQKSIAEKVIELQEMYLSTKCVPA